MKTVDLEWVESRTRENLCHYYRKEIRRLIRGDLDGCGLTSRERLTLVSHGILEKSQTLRPSYLLTPEARRILNVKRIRWLQPHRRAKPTR